MPAGLVCGIPGDHAPEHMHEFQVRLGQSYQGTDMQCAQDRVNADSMPMNKAARAPRHIALHACKACEPYEMLGIHCGMLGIPCEMLGIHCVARL